MSDRRHFCGHVSVLYASASVYCMLVRHDVSVLYASVSVYCMLVRHDVCEYKCFYADLKRLLLKRGLPV